MQQPTLRRLKINSFAALSQPLLGTCRIEAGTNLA